MEIIIKAKMGIVLMRALPPYPRAGRIFMAIAMPMQLGKIWDLKERVSKIERATLADSGKVLSSKIQGHN